MISVIIPCYNVEKTIETCFDSLMAQSYTDTEFIFIDDGSTDQTFTKLQVLSEKHSDRVVKVIHQENQGVSAARNLGLTHVTGDLLAFVDADDTMDHSYLKRLYQAIEGDAVDLAVCAYTAIDMGKGTNRFNHINPGLYDRDSAAAYLIAERGPQGYLWNKLFRTSIIREKSIRFHQDIFMAEDLLFVMEYVHAMRGAVSMMDISLYNYMIYSTSSNQTRLASLKSGYHSYFDNFFECLNRIEMFISSDLPKAKEATLDRKGRLAIQYLRANYLMHRNDNVVNRRLRKLAVANKAYFFKSSDASFKTKIIYNLVLYAPKIAYLRDKRHYK